MQRPTKKQLFLYSLLISGFIYLMIRVLWGLSSLLRGEASSYALIVLYLLFAAVIGLVGYALLRRKAAVIAASSTAMLLLGVYNLIAAGTDSLWVGILLVGLGVLGGAGTFYGWCIFLTKAKRPWLMAIIVAAVSFSVGMTASLAATYIARMSFAS